MDATEVRLLMEQVAHRLELVEARISALDARLAHQGELIELRLGALEQARASDEARLRAAETGVTRLSATMGLAQVFQTGLALVLSTIAAYLGHR